MCILDCSNAFDKVPHQRIVAKLESYGIRRQTRNCIENWLTSKVQQLVVDGDTSRDEDVRSRVPQRDDLWAIHVPTSSMTLGIT